MSRRPNASADRAEANRATLKALVKLESNKSCADCKRNKHPRWASWNLGIFICIRCSGIHRGMGTHISKVKSVDLDSWTDEQLQSMVRWGNARANKYWESKLAPGHLPSESKIENFIRTKYDSKRWVMDGAMPDPATLASDANEEMPGQAAQPSAHVERASSAAASSTTPAFRVPARPQPQMDLMGGNDTPQRPSTTEPVSRQPPSKAPAAAPKPTRPGDSLLGLDFLGGAQSSTAGPFAGSAVPVAAAPRTDLKQSILSLYASAPKVASAAPAQAQHQRNPSGSFGNLQSPNTSSSAGLNDAFSTLNFGGIQPSQPARSDPFNSFGSSSQARAPAASFGGGGSFFDPPATKAAPTPIVAASQSSHTQKTLSQSSGFGDFLSSESSNFDKPPPTPPKSNSRSAGNGLFDLTAAASSTPVPPAPKPASNIQEAFNLSSQAAPATAPPKQVPAPTNSVANADPWGSNDVWGSSNVTTQPAPPSQPPPITANGFSSDVGGWSSTAKVPPKVTQDDDFGGWNVAATPVAAPAAPPAQGKAAGFQTNSDPFENPWG